MKINKNKNILFLFIISLLAISHNTAYGMDQDFLNQPGIRMHNDFFDITSFDFIHPSSKKHNIDDSRSNLYQYKAAKAPQCHPYNNLFFSNPIFMHIQADKIALPEKIKMNLSQHSTIPLSNIDFFLVVQENTKEVNLPLLYRPHYYTDQNIPEDGKGDYNDSWKTSVTLFNLLPDASEEVNQHIFPKLLKTSLLNSQGIKVSQANGVANTHSDENKNIILSGPLESDGIGIEGLTNNKESTAFWTTLIVRQNNQDKIEKIAITLHLLLGATPYILNAPTEFSNICDFLKSDAAITTSQVAQYLDDTFFGYSFCGEKEKNQGYIASILTQNNGFADASFQQPKPGISLPIDFNGLFYVNLYQDLTLDTNHMDPHGKNQYGINHYKGWGFNEKRPYLIPIDFNGFIYVNMHPDLTKDVVNQSPNQKEQYGYNHYTLYGHSEGRQYKPESDYRPGLQYLRH